MKLKFIHSWNLTTQQARLLQNTLRNRVSTKNSLNIKTMKYIAGADVAYDQNTKQLFCVVVTLQYPELDVIEISKASGLINFPYIPGFLSFREAPILLKAFLRLKLKPDVILIDGQGIAHPRLFGLASHVGLFLDLPTIGCAKSHLVGKYKMPSQLEGSYHPMTLHKKKIGAVLRTKTGIKPLFIPPGHKIDINHSLSCVLMCRNLKEDGSIRYRTPTPTRLADLYAEAFKRKNL